VRSNMRNGFTMVETLIVIIIISLLVTISLKAIQEKESYHKEQCTAMFSLANNLRDSVKVAKMSYHCLQYIQVDSL